MLAAFGARKAAEVAGAVEGMRAELAAGRNGVAARFSALSAAAGSASDSLQVRPLCASDADL